jgi:hypothetical protein
MHKNENRTGKTVRQKRVKRLVRGTDHPQRTQAVKGYAAMCAKAFLCADPLPEV